MEIIRTILEIIAILAILYGFTHEAKVVALEKKMWRNFKSFLRRQLRKSKRIVAWAEGTNTFISHLPEAGIWKDVWFKA